MSRKPTFKRANSCRGVEALLERAHQIDMSGSLAAIGQSSFMGKATLGVGDIERARSALEASLELARVHDDPHSMTPLNLEILADVEIATNHPQQARACPRRCLDMRHESGEVFGTVRTFDRLARLAAQCSEVVCGLKLVGARDRIFQRLAARRTPAERRRSPVGCRGCGRQSACSCRRAVE